jgi:hypothetical protein
VATPTIQDRSNGLRSLESMIEPLNRPPAPAVGWVAHHLTAARWSREAALGTTSRRHKADLTDGDVATHS